MFEFIFRYFHVSYDGNSEANEADEDGADDDDDSNDDNNDDDNNDDDNENDNKNNYNDGEEGEEGDANDNVMTQIVTIVHQKNLHKTQLVTKTVMLKWKRKIMYKGLLQISLWMSGMIKWVSGFFFE